MRSIWACPDLGEPKPAGEYLPVPGCAEEFPDCPAAYLRSAADVMEIRDRTGREPVADHLIGGVVHPATLIGARAFEIKNGSRSADTLSPKALSLVHLWIREEQARDAYADELRKDKPHGR
jgi:hypothetical protein